MVGDMDESKVHDNAPKWQYQVTKVSFKVSSLLRGQPKYTIFVEKKTKRKCFAKMKMKRKCPNQKAQWKKKISMANLSL